MYTNKINKIYNYIPFLPTTLVKAKNPVLFITNKNIKMACQDHLKKRLSKINIFTVKPFESRPSSPSQKNPSNQFFYQYLMKM